MRLLTLAATTLLTACATVSNVPGEAPWTTGRLSLRVEATANEPTRSLSAGFELRGDSRSGELHLNSPLGNRMADARWSPAAVTLTTPEGERAFASLDELSRKALGETLPLAALPDWLSGRPWQQAPFMPLLTQAGATAGFEQLGWQISLARRAEGWIEARREAPPAVLLRVKLDGHEVNAP